MVSDLPISAGIGEGIFGQFEADGGHLYQGLNTGAIARSEVEWDVERSAYLRIFHGVSPLLHDRGPPPFE